MSAPQPRVLCLSGPNLQLLGTREPEVYGSTTLDEIHASLRGAGAALGVEVTCRQSNHEGELVDWIGAARGAFEGLLLNAGALSHTSLSLFDAIKAVSLPCVEVHLSNPEAREPFRHHSMIAGACLAKVTGFGAQSYALALTGLASHLSAKTR